MPNPKSKNEGKEKYDIIVPVCISCEDKHAIFVSCIFAVVPAGIKLFYNIMPV